jgi:putative PIN family toxin of toxin-antitoxin system
VIRAVLDTNLIVSYLLTQGETMSRLIAHWEQGRYVYLVSPQMVAELNEVVNRPRLRQYMRSDPAVLLELIEADAELTPGKLVLKDVCRDPNR